jgi:hypothetical protein
MILELVSGCRAGIINIQGRAFMYSIDCPFRTVDAEIIRLKEQGADVIFVDFHAEASAEKVAMGYYLNGKVSALIGSHTHVQTADERILSEGTAYITDAGMTGPHESVIGMDIHTAIQRFITQLPHHYKVAAGPLICSGLMITLDCSNGKACSIQRFQKFYT